MAGPLSAVSAAGLSVIVGILIGERPTALSLAGIGVALPAIALVSLTADRPEPGQAAGPRSGLASSTAGSASPVAGSGRRLLPRGAWPGVATGLVAGAGFALLFIGLDRAGSAAGLWPVLASQVAEVVVIGGLLTWRRGLSGGPPGTGTAVLAALTGVSGSAGTIFYFLATHHGFLAITAVLTSLYPAVTIALARLVVSERLSAIRLAGLLLAGVSVTLIALGGTA